MAAHETGIGIGIGIGDLQLATRREVRRLLKEARGNPNRAVILCLKKLVEMNLISQDDLTSLTKLFEIGFRAAKGTTPAEKAYLQCRQIADEMLASGQSSSPALALALAETNSYVSVDDVRGTPTVVYKKSQQSWESRLTAAGAVIGGALGGGGGAVLGGAIGGVVGAIVDECKK